MKRMSLAIMTLIALIALIMSGCQKKEVSVMKVVKGFIKANRDVSVKATWDYKVKDSIGAIYKGTEAEVEGRMGDYLYVERENGQKGYVWIKLGYWKTPGAVSSEANDDLPMANGFFFITNKVGASLCEKPARSKSLAGMTNGERVTILNIATTYYLANFQNIPTVGRPGWVYEGYVDYFEVTNYITNIITK